MRKIELDFTGYTAWDLSPGICTCCNNCPCCQYDYENDNVECGIDRNETIIYHICDNYLTPNCKLVNIRYTKDDKPGHQVFMPEKVELVEEL